jgi:hypothetical protein
MKMGLITPPPHIWTKEAKAFAADLKADFGRQAHGYGLSLPPAWQ